jgi:hypothetical protein
MRRGGLAGNASVMLTSCIFLKMSYDLQAKSVALADMKLLAPNTPVKRQAPLLHWHRWFAWYPVPIAIGGKLRYAWFQSVERKWGTSRYSGTIKWRYRPRNSSRHTPNARRS